MRFVPNIFLVVRRSASLRLCCILAIALSPTLSLTGCGKPEKRVQAPVLGSGDLRWPTFPVTLKADELLFKKDVEKDLRKAIEFWETKAGKKLFDLGSWKTGQAPFTGPSNNPDTLVENAIFFQAAWPFEANVAGKTFIHSEGPTITHAVIFLNTETQLCNGICEEDGDSDRTSRRKLLAHELGHFLGFAHIGDTNNIMYPEILPGGSLDEEQVDQPLLEKLTR